MNWQEQQRQANERRAQEQRAQQQRAREEQWAHERRAQEDKILRERLQREAWQRQEVVRKQAEFDQRERERIKAQRAEANRQLRERQREKNAALDHNKKRSRTPEPFTYHQDGSLPYVDRAGMGSSPAFPAVPYSGSHNPSLPTSPKPFFSFIDDWFDNFLGEPARARRILGLFALLGLVVGSGYSASLHVAILPYAVVGAAIGLILPYVLKLLAKILLAACILGLAGLLIYALIQIGK